MDRSRRIVAPALVPCVLAVWLLACGGGAPVGHPLPAGQLAAGGASGSESGRVRARHALGYAVAMDESWLVSVELRQHFALVIRSLGAGASSTPQSIELGSATYDVVDLALDSAQGRVWVASTAGWVRAYDLESGAMLVEWRLGDSVTALALSSDQRFLAIGTSSGVLCLRRLADGAELQCVLAHGATVSSIASANHRLVSASWNGEIAVWRLPSLTQVRATRAEESIADIALSPDGATLAVARNPLPPLRSPEIDERDRRDPRAAPPGRHRIELWTIDDSGLGAQPFRILAGHRNLITSVAWLGGDLLSGSWDRQLMLWSTTRAMKPVVVRSFAHLVRDVATSQREGRWAVAAWGTGPDSPALVSGRLLYRAAQP